MSKEKKGIRKQPRSGMNKNLELIFRKILENLSFACLKYN